MTPAPLRWLFAAAGIVLALGMAALAFVVRRYLDSPSAIDSDSGYPVFRVAGGYVSYRPFELGLEPTLIGIGVVLLAASVFVAAAVWQPRT